MIMKPNLWFRRRSIKNMIIIMMHLQSKSVEWVELKSDILKRETFHFWAQIIIDVLNVLVTLISKSHAGSNRNDETEHLKDDKRDRKANQDRYMRVDVGENSVVAAGIVIFRRIGLRIGRLTRRLKSDIHVVVGSHASAAFEHSLDHVHESSGAFVSRILNL